MSDKVSEYHDYWSSGTFDCAPCRFVRGDQYAVALGLLDGGEVVVGVLGCPNLPLGPISQASLDSPGAPVGCLFFASKGAGSFVQPIDASSPPKKVGALVRADPAI